MEALNMKGMFHVAFDKKAYDRKYGDEKTTVIRMRLSNEHDADILGWLRGMENMSGYLKALIRNDMRKEGANDHSGKGNV